MLPIELFTPFGPLYYDSDNEIQWDEKWGSRPDNFGEWLDNERMEYMREKELARI
jgi:hypothetical protein